MKLCASISLVVSALMLGSVAVAAEPPAQGAPVEALPNWCPDGDCTVRQKLVKPLGKALVHIVYLRSDVCPACTALEQKLAAAPTNPLEVWAADPRIELLVVDLNATEAEFNKTAYALVDRGIAPIYNGYFGLTGLMAVAQTGADAPIACLSHQYDPQAMISIVSRIADRIAAGERPEAGSDPFCPAYLNRS